MKDDDPRHGTDRGHVAHRRAGIPPCDACKRAHNRANILRELDPKPRMVTAVGMRRRIQALQAIGWSRQKIAEACGYSDAGALTHMLIRAERIHRDTAAKVLAAYEALSMTVPEGPGAARARTWARRHGYQTPLAWDDDTIDDPSARPAGAYRDRRLHKAAELLGEFEHLTRLGTSVDAAARQLGVTVGAIRKAQERAGKAA